MSRRPLMFTFVETSPIEIVNDTSDAFWLTYFKTNTLLASHSTHGIQVTTMRKIHEYLRKPRIPWRLQILTVRLQNIFFFYRNQLLHRKYTSAPRTSITFICGFHGDTGGSIAIASIANLLTPSYEVTFSSYPTSNFNRKLSKKVKLTRRKVPESDIYICDASCNHNILRTLRASNRTVIVSCHGLPDALHGMPTGYIETTLSLATVVHFVNPIQQHAFQVAPENVAVIPNTSTRIRKNRITNNIGTVGNLDEPRKGAAETIAAGLPSDAKEIHLWSTGSTQWPKSKVRPHGWENNKQKIYNSFDVLVFRSTQETFGLVVIEAMSAGIPCLLRRLPAFDAYQACPGVIMTDSEDVNELKDVINTLLSKKSEYRELMQAHFETYYSHEAILQQWQLLIESLLCGKGATSQ